MIFKVLVLISEFRWQCELVKVSLLEFAIVVLLLLPAVLEPVFFFDGQPVKFCVVEELVVVAATYSGAPALELALFLRLPGTSVGRRRHGLPVVGVYVVILSDSLTSSHINEIAEQVGFWLATLLLVIETFKCIQVSRASVWVVAGQ